eukprot:COSAG06_NODE_25781_length_628_cov_22.017013_1_plen_147_part_00
MQTNGKSLCNSQYTYRYRCQSSSVSRPRRGFCLRKTAFLSHLCIKTIILPRQARNIHRETQQKKMPFSAPAAVQARWSFCAPRWVPSPPIINTIETPLWLYRLHSRVYMHYIYTQHAARSEKDLLVAGIHHSPMITNRLKLVTKTR